MKISIFVRDVGSRWPVYGGPAKSGKLIPARHFTNRPAVVRELADEVWSGWRPLKRVEHYESAMKGFGLATVRVMVQ